eukprot:2635312-Rhodomonas_salina.2
MRFSVVSVQCHNRRSSHSGVRVQITTETCPGIAFWIADDTRQLTLQLLRPTPHIHKSIPRDEASAIKYEPSQKGLSVSQDAKERTRVGSQTQEKQKRSAKHDADQRDPTRQLTRQREEENSSRVSERERGCGLGI